MTVSDLIALLSKLPANARVVVDGYEGGLEDVVAVDAVSIRTNANVDVDYYGPHLADEIQPSEIAIRISAEKGRGLRPTAADMERGEWGL